MGAQGITMATRFLATVEAPIHQKIKNRMASKDVDERNTVIVLSRLRNATRVFANDITRDILKIEKGKSVSFQQFAPLVSGQRTKKMWQETGDWNDSMWSCGQSIGLINDIPTCKVLIPRIVLEAEEQLANGAKCV